MGCRWDLQAGMRERDGGTASRGRASFSTNPLPAKARLANDDALHHQTHRSKHQVCNLGTTFPARPPMACIGIKHRVVCRTSGVYGVLVFTLDIIQVLRILVPKIEGRLSTSIAHTLNTAVIARLTQYRARVTGNSLPTVRKRVLTSHRCEQP
jgi:hypothetical protein